MRRIAGWALLASALGTFYDAYATSRGAHGSIGLVLFGSSHLFLPLAGRFPAVLWIAAGVLGFPAFDPASWGPVSAFTVFDTATAASGIFVLWGYRPEASS